MTGNAWQGRVMRRLGLILLMAVAITVGNWRDSGSGAAWTQGTPAKPAAGTSSEAGQDGSGNGAKKDEPGKSDVTAAKVPDCPALDPGKRPENLAKIDPCTCENVNRSKVVEAAWNKFQASRLPASLPKPVLPGGEPVVVTVRQPFSKWTAESVCGFVTWARSNDDELGGVDYGPDRDFAVSGIRVEADPKDINKTHLYLTLPETPADNGSSPWRTKGTLAIAAYSGENEPTFMFAREVWVSNWGWSVVGAIAFAVLFYAAIVQCAKYGARGMSGREDLSFANPIQLTAGIYGRASLSRLQVFAFTLIVSSLIVYTWLRSGFLLEISDDLLWLMGISAAGAAGAKYTAVVKKRPAAEARIYLKEKGWTEPDGAAGRNKASAWDLLLTDGCFNIYKFQMAIFSVIVAVVVIWTGVSETGVVDIPETYLALMGLGQAVYVGGKAISESDVKRFEKLILGMKEAEKAYFAAGGTILPEGTASDDFKSTLDDAKKEKYDAYMEAAATAKDIFEELYDTKIIDKDLDPGKLGQARPKAQPQAGVAPSPQAGPAPPQAGPAPS